MHVLCYLKTLPTQTLWKSLALIYMVRFQAQSYSWFSAVIIVIYKNRSLSEHKVIIFLLGKILCFQIRF